MWRSSILIAVALIAMTVSTAHAAERVKFKSVPLPGVGPEVTIEADLHRPAGTGPFPAIIILHGSGGPHPHYDAWGQRLASQGYVAIVPDSFSPRGSRNIMTSTSSVTPHIRLWDVVGAAEYLAEQSFVAKDRIGVIGFSHGGWTIMKLIQEVVMASAYGIKAAVAYYPLCDATADRKIAVPTLILIGAKDDWTPASRCTALVADSAVARKAELVVYPDAYHSFDIDGQQARYVQGTSVGGKVEAHYLKTDPDAARDSREKAEAFFRRLLN